MTRPQLEGALRELGVRRGDVLLVHSSLASFGHVAGGVYSLYLALAECVGVAGTLVMPSFTPQLGHPSTWGRPGLTGLDIEETARTIPPFDPRRTPAASRMGVLSETLRAVPGTVRSSHPHVSFVGRGPAADGILSDHPLEYRLSSGSPLGRLADLGAKVLMLGTSWSTCTTLHLAEHVTPYPGRRCGLWPVPVAGGGETVWRRVEELLVWEGDFEQIGADYEASEAPPATITIGAATCRLVRMTALVAFAADWLAAGRDLRRYTAPPGWTDVSEAPEHLPVRRMPEADDRRKEPNVFTSLHLRPVTAADLDAFAEGLASEEGTGPFQWFGFTAADRLRAAHQENGLLGPDGGVLTVTEDDNAVGRVEWLKAAWGRPDTSMCWTVAIGLAPTARGRGIGRWAQAELVRYLFEHTRTERVQAYTDVANVGERRALEAAGFILEGVVRRGQWRDAAWHDLALYSVVRGEAGQEPEGT